MVSSGIIIFNIRESKYEKNIQNDIDRSIKYIEKVSYLKIHKGHRKVILKDLRKQQQWLMDMTSSPCTSQGRRTETHREHTNHPRKLQSTLI